MNIAVLYKCKFGFDLSHEIKLLKFSTYFEV